MEWEVKTLLARSRAVSDGGELDLAMNLLKIV
jgi:hypothetical protein